MVKKGPASSGDSTSREMIRIGFLYDRTKIVFNAKIMVITLERWTHKTIYTAEASASSMMATSASDTSTMVDMPLANTY